MLCTDECLPHAFGRGGPYANNGYCQDGCGPDLAECEEGVTGGTCAYGTDCTDCGRVPHPNPSPSPNPNPNPHPNPMLTAI